MIIFSILVRLSPAGNVTGFNPARPLIPSSTRRENLAANLQAQQLRLSEAEMQAIAGLDRGERLANPEFAPQWD